jgi:hypothetical protein
MEPDSVVKPLWVSPATEGMFTWDDTHTILVFIPDEGFAPGETHTIAIDAGLQAVSGEMFASPPTWMIETMPSPKVVEQALFDGKKALAASAFVETRYPTVRLTFSRAMDRDSVAEALRIEPAISFSLTWDREQSDPRVSDVLSIHIEEALVPGVAYILWLEQHAEDVYGMPLSRSYHWELKPAPLIQRLTVPDDAHPDLPIAIRFGYPMNPDSVTEVLHLEAQGVMSPDVEGKFVWNEDKTVVTFVPETSLPAYADLTLRFVDNFVDANGDSLSPPEPFHFTTPLPILTAQPTGQAVHPVAPIKVRFDRPMHITATASAFQITPPVSGTVLWEDTDSTVLVFQPEEGHLAEQTRYTITIGAGAKAADGRMALHKSYHWAFSTDVFKEIVDFGRGPNAQVLDVDGPRLIQYVLAQHNPANITFEVYRLSLEQFLDRYASGFRGVAGWDEERPISTEGTELVKRWIATWEPLSETQANIREVVIPQDVPPGLYVLNADTGVVNDQLILVLTRNTLMVKVARTESVPGLGGSARDVSAGASPASTSEAGLVNANEIVAWVTDINGGPVAGAEVAVYARDGTLLSEGWPNVNGVFRTSVPVDPQPLIVIARAGDDITVSGLSNEWREGYNPWWGWWRPQPVTQNYAAYVYTDRPIYRPGQEVFFKAIIRRDDDAVLIRPPSGTPVTLRIRDARNNVVQTFDLTTNAFGSVNGVFQLAEGAMLGDYKVEAELEGETHSQVFKVEDYRKPDYHVEVTTRAADASDVVYASEAAQAPERDRFIVGETIEVTVDSAYFFGEPVPDARVRTRVFSLIDRYRWTEWGVSESDAEYEWYAVSSEHYEGRTDANGHYTFDLETELDRYYSQRVDRSGDLEKVTWGIEVTVDDGSHQTVSGFAVVHIFNAIERVSLDTHGYAHQPGEPFALEAEVHDIFGAPVAERALTLTLRRWDSSRGDYDLVVQSAEMTTDREGRAALSFTIEEPGFYQLRATGSDALGHEIRCWTYVFAFSDRYAHWYGTDNALAISADKDSYAPGDTALLLIESDFSGPALLTFERGTTRREQLVELDAPVTLVEVPIWPTDVPNIYVVVNAWKAPDEEALEREPHFGMQYSRSDSEFHQASVNLSVPATDKQLTVTITSDQPTYAPREKATFTLRVTNHNGEPVSAEVSLALVDEAIFALSAEPPGSIFDTFYHERVQLVQTYNALALKRALIANGLGGGGGGNGLGGRPRSDFPDTAEWFPVLYTRADGELVVTLTLPDSLTSWRLTAKAVTLEAEVGEAHINVRTRQDIVVRPILPRFLTAGDDLTLSTIIHNYSGVTQTTVISAVVWGARASDPQGEDITLPLAIDAPVVQTLDLAPGEQRVIGWQATAVSAGETSLLVQAVISNSVMDAVLLPLSIQPLAVPDVTTYIGQLHQATVQTPLQLYHTVLIQPPDALPMSEVHLELSRSIAGSLFEGLEYLTGFPYGCVEQTMSRALPNAVVGRALNQLGVGDPTLQADLPPKINASLQRLYGYQHNDGGWGWWYDDASHDYQTAWVVFGLSTTAQAGYEVDPDVIEQGITWLNDNLDSMDLRTRAYALYSMAVAGSPNPTATLALMEQLPELDTFSRAGLALALYEAGEVAPARRVLDVLVETAIVDIPVSAGHVVTTPLTSTLKSQAGTSLGLTSSFTSTDTLTPTKPSPIEVYWSGDVQEGHYARKTMASDIRSTALALSAFVRINPGHEFEPGIVRWLMAQRKRYGWGSTNETAYAIIALTDHLLVTSFSESATATTYEVRVNEDVIATGNLGRGEPAVTLTIPASRLRMGENDLYITSAQGPGCLYYVINHRVYRPQEAIKAAGDVEVKRIYVDAETKQPLDTVSAGQLVEVRIAVTLPKEGAYILVEDYLPGGLEALNERLNTTSHVASTPEPVYYWKSYGYNHKEVWGNRVVFFITELSEGSHIYTYYARATHAGDFVALPTEVSAMYDRSIWGRSASRVFQVVEEE